MASRAQLLLPFLLHERLPAEGRVYSLVAPTTFSAGIYTAMFPEAAEPERSVLVGARVGDR